MKQKFSHIENRQQRTMIMKRRKTNNVSSKTASAYYFKKFSRSQHREKRPNGACILVKFRKQRSEIKEVNALRICGAEYT